MISTMENDLLKQSRDARGQQPDYGVSELHLQLHRHQQAHYPSKHHSSPSSNPLPLDSVSQLQRHVHSQQQHQESPSPFVSLGQAGGTRNKKLFPQKLWDLINDERYNFCLRWSDDGQLVYLNRDDFETSYLKTPENQFHTQKAISFVRQMNMYGFRKVDDCFYENDNFKRDGEHLLKNMIRKHPNKISGASGISPILSYSSTDRASSLLQHSATSLLAPNRFTTNYMECRPRFNGYPVQNRSQPSNSFNANYEFKMRTEQQDLDDEDRFNEDSLSSSTEYCRSASSSRGETLANVSDSIDPVTHQDDIEVVGDDECFGKNSKKSSHPSKVPQRQIDSPMFDSPLHAQRDTLTDQALGLSSIPPQAGQFMNFSQQPKGLRVDMRAMGPNGDVNNDSFSLEQQQHQMLQSLYGNPKELIRLLLALQSNAATTRAISTGVNQSCHETIQCNDEIQAFYSPLSNINSNLYQQTAHTSTDPRDFVSDFNRLADAQHIYNQISAQNDNLTYRGGSKQNLDTKSKQKVVQPTCFSSGAETTSIQTQAGLRIPPSSEVDYTRTSVGNSIDLRDKSRPVDWSREKKIDPPALTTMKRRDSKLGKAYKRSIDSILDSNNPDRVQGTLGKRAKQEISSNGHSTESCVEIGGDISQHAKDLVTQVALARGAQVDTNVLNEAAKCTERFVETLLETALVIARHSNSSGSSSSIILPYDGEIPSSDLNTDINPDPEKSSVNFNDLTSALKLLPSKLIKILE